MVNFRNFAASLAAASAIGSAVAHPGEVHTPEEIKREIAAHKAQQVKARRSLAECASSPAAIALKERAVARRAAIAQQLREQRGLTKKSLQSKRDQTALEEWSALDHDVSTTGYTLDTPLATIFDSNSTCSLVPEVTIGPYFVSGELIRTDITDGESGVPLHLDLQFVDTSSCTAVEDLLIDIWHCNATGVYSGVSASGQGGLDTTSFRGVQATDTDGVAQFDTIVPGHYTGRAVHIHLLASADDTILSNETYTVGSVRHIGQLFFDQSLITEVEATSPYNTNTQSLTENTSDGIAAEEATSAYDPYVDYVRLGDSIEDGLLGFITVGIDTSADYIDNYTPAANYQEGGGVDTGNSGGGGGGGPPSRK
ncbi:Intradiol ring-cleavage dioxygenase [Pestalotiopsis sp. NC0098]|nr:Intradiol ring-cleavage dioxygenase [Pestalotiopsis sp. NC0098]